MKNKKIIISVIIVLVLIVTSIFSYQTFKTYDFTILLNENEITIENVSKTEMLKIISDDLLSVESELINQYEKSFEEETLITEHDTTVSYKLNLLDKEISDVSYDDILEYRLSEIKSIETIVKIEATKVTVEDIPFEEVRTETDQLYVGETFTGVFGVNGSKSTETQIVYVNGVDMSDDLATAPVITVVDPVNQLTNVGIQPQPTSGGNYSSGGNYYRPSGGNSSTGGYSSGGNYTRGQFATLAQCEAAGNQWLANGGIDGQGGGTFGCTPHFAISGTNPAPGDTSYDIQKSR